VAIEGRSAAAGALRAAAAEAEGCTRCDLYRRATQTVFGEGPVPAPLLLVGEQPGDKEDLAGEPFVGPAGRVLDEALAEAGIGRDRVYVTNAVKHFKWEPRGKRRIHKAPSATEVVACAAWLAEELQHVDPEVVVAMGTTAVRAVFGRPLSISSLRGQVHELPDGRQAVVTVHPAAIVRQREATERRAALQGVVADLRLAADAAIRR
jgi:uracil-DNA glycosylase family protein